MAKQFFELGAAYDSLSVELPRESRASYYYRDGVVSCLFIKATTVNRTWYFLKDWNKKRTSRAIGNVHELTVLEARMRACELARQLESGAVLPTQLEEKHEAFGKALTVEQAYKFYFDGRGKNCKTSKEIEWSFGKYWGPVKTIEVRSLTGKAVRAWMDRLRHEHGESTAHKQFNLLRAAINFVAMLEIAKPDSNPFAGIKIRSKSRIDYLKPSEISKLEFGLEPESQDVKDIIWLLLFTGQRRSNVLSMEWSEIDFENKIWRIEASKTKSARDYTIALTAPALEILQRRKVLMDHTGWVFPTLKSSKVGYLNWSNIKVWARIRERAGLQHLRLHDLRHTCASWLALSGASSLVIKEALQHASVKTSEKYCHLNVDYVRDALTKAQGDMFAKAQSNSQSGALPQNVRQLVEEAPRQIISGLVRKRAGSASKEKIISVASYVRRRAKPASAVDVAVCEGNLQPSEKEVAG